MTRAALAALVQRPVAVTLALVAVVGLGSVSLMRLPLRAMPVVDRPAIRLEGEAPGLSMEVLEAGLARRLEERLMVLPGADDVLVFCADGVVVADVAFRWGVDERRARLAVAEAADGVHPGGVAMQWRAVVGQGSAGPAVVLVVAGSESLVARSAVAEDVVLPEMAAIPGVARTRLLGGARQRVVIRPDPDRLAALGVTPGELRSFVERRARRRRIGRVRVDGDNAPVVAAAAVGSAAEVAALVVPLSGDAACALSELATVTEGPWPEHGSALWAGEATVALALWLDNDANALDVERRLDRALSDLGSRLGTGVRVVRAMDSLAELRAAVGALLVAALLGATVAGLVLAILVRRVAALVVLLLVIPASVWATLPIFEGLGLGLNLVSLVGMALAVGMLVDAAVVVLEACLSAPGDGVDRAVNGTLSVVRAIVAGAVTTAVVFVPALYLRHLAASLFRQLAVALMLTLLASLAIALVAVPVAVARMAPGQLVDGGRLQRRYRRLVGELASRPWWSVAAILVCLAGCAVLARGLPQQLLPAEAVHAIEVQLLLPAVPSGSDPAPGLASVAAAMRGRDELDLLAYGYEMDTGPPLPAGFWYLPRVRTAGEVERLRLGLEGAGVVVRSAGPAGGVLQGLALRRLAVDVSCPDRAALASGAQAVAELLGEAGLVVLSDLPPARTDLRALPTPLGLARAGGLEVALSNALAAWNAPATGGLRLDESALDGAGVTGLPVRLGDGQTWPLGALVTLQEVRRPAVLARRNGAPAVRLVVGEATAEVAVVERALERATGAAGGEVEVDPAGGVLDWREARGELVLALGLGLVLVFLVLAAIYESLRLPLVVLAALPFALLGGLAAQRLAGAGLDLGSGLGLLLLAGLAVNNGVLLLDRLRSCSPEPASWGCAAAERLRPVMVTTLTTLATLAPAAFLGGPGASLRVTLARTVFAGLLVSTPAALLVLPSLARLAGIARRSAP